MQDSNKVNKSSAQQGKYSQIYRVRVGFRVEMPLPSNKHIITVETFFILHLSF